MNNAEKRNKKGQTLAEFLESYDPNRYEHPSVTVDMVVFSVTRTEDGLRLCVPLIERKDHPCIGMWALPGGFVDMDEDLSAAAARELEEETSLTGLSFRQFGTFGAVDRDPRTRVISVGYYALAPMQSLQPQAGDDAAEADLFTLELDAVARTKQSLLFRMKLSSKKTSLGCHAKIEFDRLSFTPAAVPGGDLASDHAYILFSALCALAKEPRARVCSLLCGENAPQQQREEMLSFLNTFFVPFSVAESLCGEKR